MLHMGCARNHYKVCKPHTAWALQYPSGTFICLSSARLVLYAYLSPFAVVNCGAPPSLTSPLNGDVEFMDTIFLSTATYSCDTGYRLMGPIVRECQANGMWSGGTSPPFCQSE